MEIIEIYTGKVKEVVSKKEFIKRYNKSVYDKKDNCSLVDTTQIQPQRNNYKTFISNLITIVFIFRTFIIKLKYIY